MKSIRRFVLAFLLAAIGWTVPTHAAGPSVIMIYGGVLREPIVIVKASLEDYAFLSCMGPNGIDARQLADRPYLKLAIFWKALPADPALAKTFLEGLTPEVGSQHGRLYLPTETSGASVVVTNLSHTSVPSDMKTSRNEPLYTFVALPRPLPKDEKDFTKGCWLTSADVQAARVAGVLGL